jgi:hypothetical protein
MALELPLPDESLLLPFFKTKRSNCFRRFSGERITPAQNESALAQAKTSRIRASVRCSCARISRIVFAHDSRLGFLWSGLRTKILANIHEAVAKSSGVNAGFFLAAFLDFPEEFPDPPFPRPGFFPDKKRVHLD